MTDRWIEGKQEDGFILSEILVAMVVLAIAAIGFLQTVQYAATRMHTAKTSNSQMILALSIMEDAAQRDLYDIKNGEGFNEQFNLNWRVIVIQDNKRQSQSYEQPNIKMVTVEVWKSEVKILKITSAKWAGR